MFDPFYESAVGKLGGNPIFGFSFMELKSDAARYQSAASFLQSLPFPKVPVSNKTKDQKTAVDAREDGNNFFKKGHYTSALHAYTKSLAFAPPESTALSLALANRSAVLKKMDNLVECMNDIKQALQNNYPSDLQYKLHQRNAECLMLLNKYDEALLSFEKTITCLHDSKLSNTDRKKITDAINQDKKLCYVSMMKSINVSSLSLSEKEMKISKSVLSYGSHPQFPCASNCFDLAYNEDIGRHFVATRDIAPGDTLMIETASASFLFPENLYTHCSYCLHRSVCLMPCTHCTWAMYCSPECLAADAESHKIECSLVSVLLAWDIGEISMILARIVVKFGISNISEFLKSPDATVSDPLKKGFKNGQYKSTDFDSLYHLCGNSELRNMSDLFKRATMAWCLVQCFGDLLPDPDAFGGLFVRLLQSLAVNSTTVTENFTDFRGKEEEFSVGGAIFPTYSILTHSCQPNVSVVNDGFTKMICVVQPIKKGSILTSSYGWNFMIHPKAYRQERCLSRHQFSCKCQACEENWPCGLLAWPNMPYTYREEKDRKLCEQSAASVKDLLCLVLLDKEISSQDAARICKHISVLSEAGAKKCRDYWLHIKALDHFFARRSTRYVRKYP